MIPPSGLSFALRALPGMSVELLRKKIAARLKHAGDPAGLVLWTAFEHADMDGFWERGEAMDPSRDVGWYLSDADRTVLISMDGDSGPDDAFSAR